MNVGIFAQDRQHRCRGLYEIIGRGCTEAQAVKVTRMWNMTRRLAEVHTVFASPTSLTNVKEFPVK